MATPVRADFLRRCGNHQGIMPQLDALLDPAVTFGDLYATRTRTSAGSRPVPGARLHLEAAEKRKPLQLSTRAVFRQQGYHTRFGYGEYG